MKRMFHLCRSCLPHTLHAVVRRDATYNGHVEHHASPHSAPIALALDAQEKIMKYLVLFTLILRIQETDKHNTAASRGIPHSILLRAHSLEKNFHHTHTRLTHSSQLLRYGRDVLDLSTQRDTAVRNKEKPH
jgi:hypothetical protein